MVFLLLLYCKHLNLDGLFLLICYGTGLKKIIFTITNLFKRRFIK